jgi:hypothetical protein
MEKVDSESVCVCILFNMCGGFNNSTVLALKYCSAIKNFHSVMCGGLDRLPSAPIYDFFLLILALLFCFNL